MSTKKISELPAGTADAAAVVPATNAAGTLTEKVTLGAIAALGPVTTGSGTGSIVGLPTANTNVASGDYSVVGGGENNTASGNYSSAVFSGKNNTASGYRCFIGGGKDNTASGYGYDVICGGYYNVATDGIIVGGGHNTASGFYSFIGGGHYNTVTGDRSVICGGGKQLGGLPPANEGNTVSGNYSFVGCGTLHSIGSEHSVVVGGRQNAVSGSGYAFIGGGKQNSAQDKFSTISGGYSNNVQYDGYGMLSSASSICGGRYNTIWGSGYDCFIGGGASNTASDTACVVAGGQSNQASSPYTAVGGGAGNACWGMSSVISGGQDNTTSAYLCSITGGCRAVADRRGMQAYAVGRFAENGDAQRVDFVLRAVTTDATATPLTIDWNGSGGVFLTIPSGKALFATVNVAGIIDGGSKAAHYCRKVAIKNIGGTTSLIGTVSTLGTDVESESDYDVAITADNTNDALQINVTGRANETIRWVAHVEGVEIGHG